MANQNHMIIDPTGYTPGDVNSTTVYVSGDGILKKSTDGGQTWSNLLTSAGTPPNDAGDSPAPTNTDLTYTRMAYNTGTGDLVVQAEWQEAGGEWRYWILNKTLADSYSWTGISGDSGADPRGAGAPTWAIDCRADDMDATLTNLDNITSWTNQGTYQDADDDGGALNAPQYQTSVQGGRSAVSFDDTNTESLDFGSPTRPADYTIIILAQANRNDTAVSSSFSFIAASDDDAPPDYAQNTSHTNMGLYRTGTNSHTIESVWGDDTSGVAVANYTHKLTGDIINDDNWHVFSVKHTDASTTPIFHLDGTSRAVGTTYQSDTGSSDLGNDFPLRLGSYGTIAHTSDDHFSGYMMWILVSNTAIADADIVDYSNYMLSYAGLGNSGEARPLDISPDNFSGSHVWATEWDGTIMRLVKRASTTMTLTNQVSLGSATEAQINARTYYAKVFSLGSPSGASDTCFVYGRWDNGGVAHLAKTTDGAATLGSNIGGSWGADWVSELFALNENTIFAFVAGVSPTLYRTDDGGSNWTSLGALPFDVDSASLSASGIMAICSSEAVASQVAMSESPFSTWTDASTGLSASDTKKAIRWV